jgi:hypothetical protein
MINRSSGPIEAAAVSSRSVNVQAGAPVNVTEKSVPATRGVPTGVVPSEAKSCAVTAAGATSHMPPSGPLGRMSAKVAP